MTKSQAEAKLRELIQAEQAFRAVADRVTIAEAAAAHLQRLEVRAVKRSYLQTVESIERVHLADAPEFRTKELARIDEDDIERYVLTKTREGKAPKTIRNHLGVSHSVVELGQRRKWCARNPVKLAEGPKVRHNQMRIRFLTQEELEALLRAPYADDALGSIEPTLYLTAALTGLRKNELIALGWHHIDWPTQRIRVLDGYVRGQFNDPKSEHSARSVPMATRVAQELERLHQRSLWKADDHLVFAHPYLGTPIDGSKILRRLKDAEDRAGVRRVTFHELRHTFGTRMAAAGVPLRTIQECMGHTDTKTTAIYAHYSPAANQVALVDAAFGSANPDVGADSAVGILSSTETAG